MKKTFLMTVVLSLILCGSAFGAISFTISPTSTQLSNLYLDHYSAYVWRINSNLYSNNGATLFSLIDSGNYQVTGASLAITGLNNWSEPEDDSLYVRLLDNYYKARSNSIVPIATTGVTVYSDNSVNGDYNANWGGEALGTFYDTNQSAVSNYNYIFDPGELSILNGYIANNGFFGIGFDPDCHYDKTGITLSITLAQSSGGGGGGGSAVPEPATLFLFGSGLIVLTGMARKRISKLQ